jgi:DNA polymerase-3 subunit alpha
MSFVHFHRHGHHSRLDGLGTGEQWASEAARLGQQALALTDHDNLSGALEHMDACDKHGIMSINGVEAYFRPNRFVIGEKEWLHTYFHLVLLAKSYQGWLNLIKITSQAYHTGFYGKPCVDWALLEEFGEGLICSTACISGPLADALLKGDAEVRDIMGRFRRIFGDNLVIEIMPHDWDKQRELNLGLISAANHFGVRMIATVDAHYPFADWYDTQKILTLISTNTTIEEHANKNAMRRKAGEDTYDLGHAGLYLMTEEDVAAGFRAHHPNIPEPIWQDAIGNTGRLAAEIDPFVLDRTLKLPKVMSSEKAAYEQLKAWCDEGLERIGKADDDVYQDRVTYELGIMRDKRVCDYMVLVARAVHWAKSTDPIQPDLPPKRPIRVGSGRGSAAGSIVSYLCQITALDPIGHKLLFERFLNPDRVGLPDIDIDFESGRRDEVKEWWRYKYGDENVADVVAHSTFAPRAVIQDVARIMGIDYLRTKQVTDSIDPVHDPDLKTIRLTNKLVDSYLTDFPDLWHHAERLEGMCKGLSKHAGGVVITTLPTNDSGMPTLRTGKDASVRTAWGEPVGAPVISKYGYVKIDALSIAGMDQQQQVVDSVWEHQQERIELDSLKVCIDPYEVDDKVMDVFRKGRFLGINQLESKGITQFVKQIKATTLVDIIAALALYRPGPLGGDGMAFEYAKRKNGLVEWDFPHETCEPFLADTYGILVFQEQVMQIFSALAGYSLAEADGIRKLISKLYRLKGDGPQREMAKYKTDFLERNILTAHDASAVWNQVAPFCAYSFNRAHSAGYGVQAYQDAWEKAYYPVHFYAALLSLEPEKAAAATREARHFGVRVSAPDINKSGRGFSIDVDSNIMRYGLIGIKNVADASIKAIEAHRPYTSYDDFDARVPKKSCNKRVKESLVLAGAFDAFGERDMLTQEEIVDAEISMLGMSVTVPNALEKYRPYLQANIYTQIEVEELEDDESVIIGGEVLGIREVTTKKGKNPGQLMGFVDLAFDDSEWSVTFFPGPWNENRALLLSQVPMMIRGKKQERNGEAGIIGFGAAPLEELYQEG